MSLALLSGAASAANLGGVVKGGSAVVATGESHTFDALLWSSDGPRQVSISAEHPEGWTVFVTPESALLGDGGGQAFLSPSPVPAVPVRLFVRPEGAGPGTYFVYIVASGPVGDGGVRLSQGIRLKATVEVPGGPGDPRSEETVVEVSPSSEPASVGDVGQQAPSPPSGVPDSERPDHVLYLALAVVGVLAVSLLIYRYA